MRRELGAIVFGIGLEVTFLVLGVWLMVIPDWLAVTGLASGGLLILIGFGIIIWPIHARNAKGGNKMSNEEQRYVHIESHGQTGGIIAGGNVNIHGDLGPKVELTEITQTALPNGQHRHETILTVHSQYTVPAIRITAYADSIRGLGVVPQRSGMHTFGHTGKREGYHFTTIQSAAGQYRIRVLTDEAEPVQIDVG